MKPILATVLVRIETGKQNENQLIERPTSDWKDMNIGVVEEVGEGTPEYPNMICKKGDRVRWWRNAGERISYNGKPYILLSEEKREIAAILDKE